MAVTSPVPSQDDLSDELPHSGAPTDQRPFTLTGFLQMFTFVGVIYVLSPGPVMWLLELLPDDMAAQLVPVFTILYGPLQWACDHSVRVAGFYDWYLELFA